MLGCYGIGSPLLCVSFVKNILTCLNPLLLGEFSDYSTHTRTHLRRLSWAVVCET